MTVVTRPRFRPYAKPKPIKVGQHWKRNKDGVVVKIITYKEEFDDCRYVRVDGQPPRAGNSIFGYYLRQRYTLVKDVRA